MNTNNDTRSDDKDDGTKSPEQLEREVDQARASVDKSASELSDRFSPGELIDQAFSMAREHGGDFGRNLGAQVKNNPLPLMLTSVGISWMMMASSSTGVAPAHATSGMKSGKSGGSVKDKLGDAAAKSQDKAEEVGDRMQDATANANEYAQQTRDSLAQFYREQPLLAGSLGVAIGAALGALIPPSDLEDDMFGEASDHSVEAAKSKAEGKYDEVRESVGTQH